MNTYTIRAGDEIIVDWTREPVFAFDTEVDALTALQGLAEQLDAARKQVTHVMRYIASAVRAASQVVEDDGTRISKQAIINHSRLARQTVFDLLAD